ncbi:MAG: methyltransferase, partial [Methanomicrobiales archaeon]|nr:methyltransferase [Methanomicrobiales archaeon]
MAREAWCLRVPKSEGERRRLELLEEGLLDTSLILKREGDELLLPLTESRGGCGRSVFEEAPERPDLPRHDLIGGIAVL